MSKFAYRVYVDESGDEGFVFKADGSGSPRWLVLSALVIRQENDLQLVALLKNVRQLLRKDPHRQLHFSDLKHEQRVPYVKQLAELPVRTVSVLIHKPSIRDPETFQAVKFRLYRYASRLLLERVSWLCRDRRQAGDNAGRADLVFSNRSIMSYDDLKDYLGRLKNQDDPLNVNIDWDAIDPENVRAVNHDQLAGLQAADAVASSFYYAVNPNRYGEVEDKYARMLMPTGYRHKGAVLGYGLKFWPDDVQKLKSANPHLAWFAD